MLDMPEATSVIITGNPKIAKAGDGATYSPFDVASAVEFTITIYFEDGSSQDFSTDSRTQFSLTGATVLVQMDGNIMTVLDDADVSEDADTVAIQVSFTKNYAVTFQTTISVVKLASFVARSSSWPAQSKASGEDVTVLRSLGCSGIFQRLEGWAVGSLSDGTSTSAYELYRQVTFSSSNAEVAWFDSEPCYSGICRGLAPKKYGTTTITGSFASHSYDIEIEISSEGITIVSLKFVDDIGTDTTLNGAAGCLRRAYWTFHRRCLRCFQLIQRVCSSCTTITTRRCG